MSLRATLAAKGDEVVSIDSSADLSAAAKLLTKRHIGALVVVDAGERPSKTLGTEMPRPLLARVHPLNSLANLATNITLPFAKRRPLRRRHG